MQSTNELARKFFGKSVEDLDDVEKLVLTLTSQRQLISSHLADESEPETTFGGRLADRIARVGGSWSFIVTFVVFLVIWALVNTIVLTRDAFDPYPFIFLNLVLSMVAALQAPVIMMSQNRQTERDRAEASKDYAVNLKAEIDLIALHHKIDTMVLKDIASLREEIGRLHEAVSMLGDGKADSRPGTSAMS